MKTAQLIQFCLAGAVFVSFCLDGVAQNEYGFTEGKFNVSDGGASVYHIPLKIPGGTGGMQPELGLVYNSFSENGVLGVGWSLTGLSTITLNSANKAIDGYRDGLFVGSEYNRFHLDQERLVLTSSGAPEYGVNNSVYRKEVDDETKIVSRASSFGVDYFEVFTKAGLKYEYGNSADSKLGFNPGGYCFTCPPGQPAYVYNVAWAVNKISDTKGNYIKFNYSNVVSWRGVTAGTILPKSIEYTFNDQAGLSSRHSIEFVYEPRTDVVYQNILEAEISISERLKKIIVRTGSVIIKTYTLTYGPGVPSKIVEIQESGEDDNKLRPTKVFWAATHTSPVTRLQNSYTKTINPTAHVLIPSDWNGDGYSDLLLYDKASGTNEMLLNNRTESSARFSPAPGFAINANDIKGGVGLIPIELDGDGYQDLVWYDKVSGNLKCYRNERTSFRNAGQIIPSLIVKNSFIFWGDWNADGRTDYMTINSQGNEAWYVNVTPQPLNGGAGIPSVAFSQLSTTTSKLLTILPEVFGGTEKDFTNSVLTPISADFNADGTTDFFLYESSTGANSLISIYINRANVLSANRSAVRADAATGYAPLKNGNFVFGGDISELLWYDPVTGNNRVFCGTESKLNLFSPTLFKVTNLSVRIIDYDQDSRGDLFLYNTATGQNSWFRNITSNQTSAGLCANNLQFEEDLSYQVGAQYLTGGNGIVFGDWSGKGLNDILWYNNAGNSNMFLYPRKDVNLIERIEEGNGFEVEIKYDFLTNKDLYTKFTTSYYPVVDFIGALNVVSSYSLSNGIGGMNEFKYKYEGAVYDANGRGFRGFSVVSVTDLQTGIKSISTFTRQSIKYGLDLSREKQESASGKSLKTVTYTINKWDVQFTDVEGNLHQYAKINNTVKSTAFFDLNGIEYKIFAERYDYEDPFVPSETNELVNAVLDYGSGLRDSTSNQYTNNVGKWLLGRLTSVSYAKKLLGQPYKGRSSLFEYNEQGLLTKEVFEPGNSKLETQKTYTYDAYGNRIKESIVGHDGVTVSTRTETTQYDGYGEFPTSKTNALGHNTTFEYDGRWGNLSKMTGPNGLSVKWEYDKQGRKVKEIRPDGITITKEYLWCTGGCPPTGNYYVVSKQPGSPTSTTYYDMLGREIRSQTEGFDGKSVFIDRIYNAQGRPVSQSEPYYAGQTAKWTHFEYDEIGRIIKTTFPDNSITTTTYADLTETTRNAKGQTKTKVYNGRDQLVRVTDTNGSILEYEYDAFGHLIEVKAGASTIKYTYDNAGNMIQLQDPDLGTIKYEYNAFSQVIKKINAKGLTTNYKYDLLNRLIERTDLEGGSKWTYDLAAHGIGKVYTVENNLVKEKFEYDTYGRPGKATRTIQGENFSETHEYDEFGNLKQITYPSGYRVQNIFNERGYLERILDSSGKLLWQLTEANARGQVVKQKYGNEVVTTSTFDEEMGRLQSIKSSIGSTVIQDLAYGYDLVGNLISRQDKRTTQTETFEFDQLNRLTRTAINNTSDLSVNYDASGNITFKSDLGAFEYYPDKVHALKQITLSSNARVGSLPTTRVSYTSFDKVSFLRNDGYAQEIKYDAAHQRAVATRFIDDRIDEVRTYVFKNYEKIVRNEETSLVHYIMGPNGAVATHISNSAGTKRETIYWHKDHLGSLDATTGESGTVKERFSFDAWGARRDPANWKKVVNENSGTPYRGYTGHEHYAAFQLIEMNGRVYNPAAGRFLSPDPFIVDMEDLQSFNRFAYVNNNPLTNIDPSGYFLKELGRAVGKVVKEVGRFVEKNKDTLITIAAVGAGLATMGGAAALLTTYGYGTGTFLATVGSAAGFGFGMAGTATLLSGGSLGDAFKAGIKSAFISGITAGLTFGVGEMLDHPTIWGNVAGKAVSHGLVQGLYTDYMGGEFEHGFFSGASVAFAQLGISHINSPAGRVMASALVGGTASSLGGGKFMNGAVSGAMINVYNDNWKEWFGKKIEAARDLVDTKLGRAFDTAYKNGIGAARGVNEATDYLGDTFDNFKQYSNEYNDYFSNAPGAYTPQEIDVGLSNRQHQINNKYPVVRAFLNYF